ncbi:hypothetical protein [Nonomuraea gerenzanensis]|uniref:Uncharacterized protein n=1 Tax=Nonomuraea gerenzanensis TaxID=93944 RepID=A0A1M4DWS6_9ACTN|nr:hypothetical protein [Nonomuraea gerenzanensis]UBU13358.1 hypothetical protein LCN96_55560 [Nonomuraea gerenzanensis]SBO91017.1 hypothetical protein BN4615_P531 [Nonomuraea gerenzanensis]
MRKIPQRMVKEEDDLAPSQFLQLAAVDFNGVYAVHLAAKEERLKMTRLALSLLAGPFFAAIALASAKVVDPQRLTEWQSVPWYLFALVIAFGVLSVLPFLRLIEAVDAHARTARAINNFRLLYSTRLRDDLDWSPNLPVDPRFPETYAPLAWPGINVMVLATVNSTYLTVGVTGLSGQEPNLLLLLTGILLVALVHYAVYYIRCNVSRRRRLPRNRYQIPTMEG